ncbi:major facilitator superfamily domain-containing protein 1-like [Ornithodoros turicata]|uniref:major facilitator superfamily domain-containing protein 1-like n=1 Tax=Ornithodoros turicata TaxID=34597 RepID=UPI003139D854
MGVSTADFHNLHAWRLFVNIISCHLGGFLISRLFGIRRAVMIFISFAILGKGLSALGGFAYSFRVMKLGYFVSGFGGESLDVALGIYTVCWFKGKMLNTAFVLQLCLSAVGDWVSSMTMPNIYNAQPESGHARLGVTLLVPAAATCIFFVGCIWVLEFLDKRAGRICKAAETEEVVHLPGIKKFPVSFWALCFICVSYYITILPSNDVGTALRMKIYNFSESEADSVESVLYIFSAIALLLSGILFDKIGMNLMWMCISVVVTVVCHALLVFSPVSPSVPVVSTLSTTL